MAKSTKPVPPPATKAKADVPAKQASREVSAGQMPDYIRGKAGQGVVGWKPEDLIIPRLDLMQDGSPKVVDGDQESGEFVHNVTEESFGPSVDIIPLIAKRQYMLWKPRHEGGGILARADDGIHWVPANKSFEVMPHKGLKKKVVWTTAKTVDQSGLAAWGSMDPDDPDSPPAANEMATIVFLIKDKPNIGPVVASLQRGSLGVGKKFVQRLMFDEVPTCGRIWTMEAVAAQNAEGQSFWSYKFSPAGWTPKELFEQAEKLQKRFLELGFQIKDEEDLQGGEDDGKPGKTFDV